MFKRKNFLMLFLSILLCSSSFSFAYIFIYLNKSNNMAKPVEYSIYVEKADILFNELSEAYNVTENSYHHMYIQPYSSNFKGEWADSIGDTFEEIDDNNLILGESKKREIYIESPDQSVGVKVGLHYAPKIQFREYLVINSLDEVAHYMMDEKYLIPVFLEETFTDNGMVIQVTVFSLDDTIDNEDMYLRQNDMLIETVTAIQEVLVSLDDTQK